MKTSVILDLREQFTAEVEDFILNLNTFLEGKGPVPVNNTETIKNKFIKLSTADMIKSGTPRGVAQRVSKSCFEEMLDYTMAAA